MARVRQSVGEAMSQVEAAALEIRELLADLLAGRVSFVFTLARDGARLGVGVRMAQEEPAVEGTG